MRSNESAGPLTQDDTLNLPPGGYRSVGNMRLDPNPLFRRMIMPWYDSTPLCWCLIAVMVIIALFSIVGIFVALEEPRYRGYAWMPWTLLLLCLFVTGSVAIRLIRRNMLHRDGEP